MCSARIHERRTTSLATHRVLSSADSIARVVSRPTPRVLTIWRRFAATGDTVLFIESPRVPRCTGVGAPICIECAAFAAAASPRSDASTRLGRRFAPPSRTPCRRDRVVDSGLPRRRAHWHEACTAGPAIGTRNAAVASTLLNEGSFANRFFDMRSHDGAGILRQHHVRSVLGGSASCRLNFHKSKKVCRRQGGCSPGPRPLRTRLTGT